MAALLPMVLAVQITGLAYFGDVTLFFTVVAVYILESSI